MSLPESQRLREERGLQATASSGQATVFVARLVDWPKTEIYVLDRDHEVKTSSSLWRVAPQKFLSITAPGEPPIGANEYQNAIQTDVAASYAHFLILGQSAADLLAKLTSCNLIDLSRTRDCLIGPVAKLRCIVHFEDKYQIPAFHLLCSREYGVSMEETLLHAGREFYVAEIDAGALSSMRTSGHQTGSIA